MLKKGCGTLRRGEVRKRRIEVPSSATRILGRDFLEIEN